MDHDVARQFAWCKTGVPHPTAAEVKALLTDLDAARADLTEAQSTIRMLTADLDAARAAIAEQATPSAPVSPNLSDP